MKTKFVGLIELARQNQSFCLIRTKAYPWYWLARLHVNVIVAMEQTRDFVCTVRIVSPARAEELMTQYNEWVKAKAEAPKMSKQLDNWRSKRKPQKPQTPAITV